jgi:hypothetical protein
VSSEFSVLKTRPFALRAPAAYLSCFGLHGLYHCHWHESIKTHIVDNSRCNALHKTQNATPSARANELIYDTSNKTRKVLMILLTWSEQGIPPQEKRKGGDVWPLSQCSSFSHLHYPPTQHQHHVCYLTYFMQQRPGLMIVDHYQIDSDLIQLLLALDYFKFKLNVNSLFCFDGDSNLGFLVNLKANSSWW